MPVTMLRTLLIVSLIFLGAPESHADCVGRDPDAVLVEGTLERVTFPGPPNYESIQNGDLAETYFVLRLAAPICIQTSERGRVSSSELQLFLQPWQYALLRPRLGVTMKVSGRLWPAETGHHHTALMFTPAIEDPGEVPDEPVLIGTHGHEDLDACLSIARVAVQTSGHVSVRAAPHSTAREIDQLPSGHEAFLCSTSSDGDWHGVVYPRKANQDCGVTSLVAHPQSYAGPCKSGWIEKSSLKVDAG